MQLKNVRLAYVQTSKGGLYTPGKNDDGGDRYSVVCILPKDDPQVEEIRKGLKQAAKDKWQDKAAETYKQLEKTLKLALHDGEEKSGDGFGEDVVFVSLSNKVKPTMKNGDKSNVADDQRPFYSGCYAHVICNFWAQDNKFGKRINGEITGIMFAKAGDPIGGGGVKTAADDDFDGLDGEMPAEDEFEGL